MLIVKVKELEDLFEERVGDSRGMMLAFQGYEPSLETFFLKMIEKAMQRGVCIQDKLANPTAEQIAYFQEQLGECTEPFEVSYAYVRHQCKKWLTFLSDTQAHVLSCAIHETLKRLQRMGKNESVLKNAYMKFMCWWYYHFRKCLSSIGIRPFYVLYEGSLTAYEAYMLTCVALCGGRVGIVDYDKTAEKWKDMQEIQVYCPVVGQVLQPFPNREMIKGWKASVIATSKVQSMFGQRPSLHPCVNAWLQDVSMESIKDMQRSQKADQMDSFYMRVDGCADRNTYANELFQLWQDKKAQGPVLMYEGDVPVLQTSEVSWVQRPVQLEDLSIGTVIASNMSDFTGALRNYCCHLLWDMSQQDEGQIGLKMNKTVMRLGILRRYQQLIKEKGALFVFETEPLHAWSWQVFELLVRCGVDVLVCNPNKVLESYTSDVNGTNAESFQVTDNVTEKPIWGKYLRKVMYDESGQYSGELDSGWVGPMTSEFFGTVDIIGTAVVHNRPSYEVNGPIFQSTQTGCENYHVIWEIADDDQGTNGMTHIGLTNGGYLEHEDVGKFIRVVVVARSPFSQYVTGQITSAWVEVKEVVSLNEVPMLEEPQVEDNEEPMTEPEVVPDTEMGSEDEVLPEQPPVNELPQEEIPSEMPEVTIPEVTIPEPLPEEEIPAEDGVPEDTPETMQEEPEVVPAVWTTTKPIQAIPLVEKQLPRVTKPKNYEDGGMWL